MVFLVKHFFIFALPIAILLGTLGGCVRAAARRRKLPVQHFQWEALIRSVLCLGVVGACGQGLFALLQSTKALGVFPSRLVVFCCVGSLCGVVASRTVPYMLRSHAAIFGAIGGLVAEMAYSGLLRNYGEGFGRIAAEGTLCAIISLAVRFPVPEAERIDVTAQGVAIGSRSGRESYTPTPPVTAPPPPSPRLAYPTWTPLDSQMNKLPTTRRINISGDRNPED